MTKFSEQRRKLLRTFYRGLLATVAPTMFQACSNSPGDAGGVSPAYGPIDACCAYPAYGPIGAPAYGIVPAYGMPPGPAPYTVIRGTVFSESDEAPLPEIKVSVKDLFEQVYTNETGEFEIHVPMQDSYKLKFEDVNGFVNRLFQTQKRKITLEEIVDPLDIYLTYEDEDISSDVDEE